MYQFYKKGQRDGKYRMEFTKEDRFRSHIGNVGIIIWIQWTNVLVTNIFCLLLLFDTSSFCTFDLSLIRNYVFGITWIL